MSEVLRFERSLLAIVCLPLIMSTSEFHSGVRIVFSDKIYDKRVTASFERDLFIKEVVRSSNQIEALFQFYWERVFEYVPEE